MHLAIRKEYNFFEYVWAFIKVDHIVVFPTNFNKYQRRDVLEVIFSGLIRNHWTKKVTRTMGLFNIKIHF